MHNHCKEHGGGHPMPWVIQVQHGFHPLAAAATYAARLLLLRG